MIRKYKYLILRRSLQVSLMFLYFAGNAWGFTFLQGNLSSSLLLGVIPLSDPYAALQMLVAGAVLSSDLVIGVLIITLFYASIGGRAFCSWVCPINIISDASNYIRRKFGFNKIQKKQPASRNLRYFVLFLSLILSYFLGLSAFEFISPISMVHRGLVFGMGFGYGAIVIIFLFDLFVLKNGWCGHICPLGAFYSLNAKFSLIKVDHDVQKCTACMECKEVCPETQVLFMINKESIPVLSGECTSCARCIEVCNDDALNFTIRNFKGEKNET